MAVVLYHKPKCSTSRNALALLREEAAALTGLGSNGSGRGTMPVPAS